MHQQTTKPLNLRSTNGLPVTTTEVMTGVKMYSHLAKNWERQNDRWTETTEATYYDALGALPPAYQDGRTFALGEAWKSNSQNEDIFAVFTFTGTKSNKRFFVRYMTIKDAEALNFISF